MWEIIGGVSALIVIFIIVIVFGIVSNKNFKKNLLNSIKNGDNVLPLLLSKKNGFLIKDYEYVSQSKSKERIDYIFLSNKGIYLINVKTLSGEVKGSEQDSTWICIPKKGNQVTFTNPIKKLNEQIDLIEDLLNEETKINSYVVFVGATTKELLSDKGITQDNLLTLLGSGEKVISNKKLNKFNDILTRNN